MVGRKILGLIAIVGLAKLAFGGHRHGAGARGFGSHRMGPQGRGEWQDRVAAFHRELHRQDAEAMGNPAAGASAPTDAA